MQAIKMTKQVDGEFDSLQTLLIKMCSQTFVHEKYAELCFIVNPHNVLIR